MIHDETVMLNTEDKKRQMLEKELEMLNSFYERNAITKDSYEKGVAALESELEALRGE